MPHTRILAFDLNPDAQTTCHELARKNKVTDRVAINGVLRPEDFAEYAGQHILVICDIEGSEKDLLDPAVSPALAGMDLIVESHECQVPGMTRLLMERFANTHDIVLVQDNGQRHLDHPPDWFNGLSHLDQLLAVWEWRTGPTPWLVMKSRQEA